MELFEAVGGTAGCHKLSKSFYSRVQRDPVLRPLFPGKSMKCAIEAFTSFLVQFLGGPTEDTQHRWSLSLRESHDRFRIGGRERDAWLGHMSSALAEAQFPEPARCALWALFDHGSAYLVNQDRSPAAHTPIEGEMAQRWGAQQRIDQAVAALRHGDIEKAMALVSGASRPVLTRLLSLMIARPERAALECVCEALRADPALVQERYFGRTLMHAAAGAGNLPVVELLLSFGVDPNVRTAANHAPLYSAANECSTANGPAVVHALVQAGADVNAADGVQRCTPLHMAARRGNVQIAKALLECGADVKARDKRGDTPLQRAINCRKEEVAELLRRRAE